MSYKIAIFSILAFCGFVATPVLAAGVLNVARSGAPSDYNFTVTCIGCVDTNEITMYNPANGASIGPYLRRWGNNLPLHITQSDLGVGPGVDFNFYLTTTDCAPMSDCISNSVSTISVPFVPIPEISPSSGYTLTSAIFAPILATFTDNMPIIIAFLIALAAISIVIRELQFYIWQEGYREGRGVIRQDIEDEYGPGGSVEKYNAAIDSRDDVDSYAQSVIAENKQLMGDTDIAVIRAQYIDNGGSMSDEDLREYDAGSKAFERGEEGKDSWSRMKKDGYEEAEDWLM